MAAKHEKRERGVVLCVTGTESTGKTTLAVLLAQALEAPLVPEIARRELAGRHGYSAADVLAIAQKQRQAEDEALSGGARLVVADTDLTVIQVWWEEKYGELHPWIARALDERSERRYLLARPDLPWEPDPLRESPLDRERLHARYLELMQASPFPCFEVSGLGEDRLTGALDRIRRWMG